MIETNLRTSLSLSYPSFSLNSATLSDLANDLDLDPDPYLSLALNETLRLEPPVPCSTSFCLTETTNISGVEILAGDMLITNIYKLHHLEDQWGADHDKFRPERFITRGRRARHPMSFMPFIAGKRACLGKTLAEKGIQVIVPLIMKACKKICKVDKGDKPMYNVVIVKVPEIKLKLHF